MGLSRDGVEVVGDSVAEATCGLLGKLLHDDHELVTLIEGEGSGAARPDASRSGWPSTAPTSPSRSTTAASRCTRSSISIE